MLGDQADDVVPFLPIQVVPAAVNGCGRRGTVTTGPFLADDKVLLVPNDDERDVAHIPALDHLVPERSHVVECVDIRQVED